MGRGRWEGGDVGKTSLVHSSNAEPHKAGHGVPLPLAQRLQLAAEHLVWGGTECGGEPVMASPTEALSSTGLHPKAGLALLPACLPGQGGTPPPRNNQL